MNKYTVEAIPYNPEADRFDLRKSFESIKHSILGHKLLIACSIFATTFLMLLYIMIWPPTYISQAIVMAEAVDDKQRQSFYSEWNVFRSDNLPDEVELMTSAPVLEAVVDRLDLTYAEVYHPFMSHLGYLWVESWLGKSWRRFKDWLFDKPVNPYGPTQEQVDRARTIYDFKSGVALSPFPETHIGALIVKGPTPRVFEIANTIVEEYLRLRKERYVEEAQRAYDSLKTETEKARQELLAMEEAMEDYHTENTLLLAYEKDKVEVSQWLSLRAANLDTRSTIAAMEDTLAEVDRQLANETREVIQSRVLRENSNLETLEAQLIQLQLSLQQARLRYREDSPEVTEIVSQIDSITMMMAEQDASEESSRTSTISATYEGLRQRRSELLTALAGARASLEVKQASEEELRVRVSGIPDKLQATHAMGRDHSLLENKYTQLRNKLNTAAVSLATVQSAPAAMKFVQRAQPPEKPKWPKSKIFLIAAMIMGAMFGVLIAMLVDLLYGRVTRYNLVTGDKQFQVYAVLVPDGAFAREIYSLPNPERGGFLPRPAST